MPYDFKKADKAFYLPGEQPGLVDVPEMNFIAVEGAGDPNEENGAYSRAVGLLYALSYTIKMSEKAGRAIAGYFAYVVPPLEGLWWMEDGQPSVDYSRKSAFCWTAMIRQPDFVDDEVFAWACKQVREKKKLETAPARRLVMAEGLCVQCMHIGPYDAEPDTVGRMERFMEESGYCLDFSASRRHHEIYLGDPRKTTPQRLRTVIRHPVRPEKAIL